jgi:hypothetical protein
VCGGLCQEPHWASALQTELAGARQSQEPVATICNAFCWRHACEKGPAHRGFQTCVYCSLRASRPRLQAGRWTWCRTVWRISALISLACSSSADALLIVVSLSPAMSGGCDAHVAEVAAPSCEPDWLTAVSLSISSSLLMTAQAGCLQVPCLEGRQPARCSSPMMSADDQISKTIHGARWRLPALVAFTSDSSALQEYTIRARSFTTAYRLYISWRTQ